MRKLGLLVALIGSISVTLPMLVLLTSPYPAAAAVCDLDQPAVNVVADVLPGSAVAGYAGEQLRNAALIANAAGPIGGSVRAQLIAVMTAMGESSLLIVDHGDTAGPDSRGLFQQRGNGAWGSYADRMDPTISATNFYRALLAVDDWTTLPPTIAAHRVQRNADPWHYERYWTPAVQVLSAMAGQELESPTCSPSSGSVAADSWIRPSEGPITSQFGMRQHPVTGIWKLHTGTDFGGACGSPILAAAAGTVVKIAENSAEGWNIRIDHGNGIATRYLHMYVAGVHVLVGQQVTAGQHIGDVGSAGYSTGCHLHFEVFTPKGLTNPADFLRIHGVDL